MGRSAHQDLRSCAILQASLALSPVSSSICCTHVQQGRPRGASTPAWCPVYRLHECPQPGVVRSGLQHWCKQCKLSLYYTMTYTTLSAVTESSASSMRLTTSSRTVACRQMLLLSWTTASDKTHSNMNWQRASCNIRWPTRTDTYSITTSPHQLILPLL